MLLDYSFHSHTYRCGHAYGDIEDYVKLAIKNGFKYFGISDHVFLPGVNQKYTRGDISELDGYINEFNRVKEKYKDLINLYLGFECEYAPVFVDYYNYLKNEKGIQYLICGQHMNFDDQKMHHWYFGYDDIDDEKGIERYKNDLIEAMKSKLFLYIAHPDLYLLSVTRVTPFIDKITEEIIRASIEYDIPLEINLNGVLRRPWDREHGTLGYPTDYFWNKAAKMGAKIILGGDYHQPEIIENSEIYVETEKIIKNNSIELMDVAELLKRINK